MTNLDRMDELASELFKFTLTMSDSEASERLQQISEKVLAKRAAKDKRNEHVLSFFPSWEYLDSEISKKTLLNVFFRSLLQTQSFQKPLSLKNVDRFCC